ncbi:MAG: ABC transporter permease [Salinibacter sp.]|uniref:ABC transporter permease n=1 Tax=Salinibacter sp. TaxID=2065818 RepID=UPI002FC36A30
MSLRYLWGAEGREEGRSFLRFIIYVAIGGVTLGVAALLLALAIVRGFSAEIEKKIVGFGAHIQVSSYVQDEPLQQEASLQAQLSQMEDVSAVSPVIEQPVLLRRSKEAIDGVVLLGMDQLPSYLETRLTAGRFAVEAQEGTPGLVVGQELAARLGLEVGQQVTIFALQSGQEGASMGRQRPRVKQFRIRGIYDTSLQDIDDVYVFSNVSDARWLGSLSEASVSRFNITVSDPGRIDSLAAQIENKFGFPVSARTIYQQYAGLFAWVDLQQSIIPLVIGVIVIVAAFNIVGTLLMLVLEKTREIGILKSLGTSGRTLKRLFLALGLLIGAVGTALGTILAFSFALLQKQFGLISLPAEAYYMTTAPVGLNPLDFLVVGITTILLCGAAAYVPARVAARIEPVKTIRFE